VGSIPIARSKNPVDTVGLTGFPTSLFSIHLKRREFCMSTENTVVRSGFRSRPPHVSEETYATIENAAALYRKK
jgi:hypothetical protein